MIHISRRADAIQGDDTYAWRVRKVVDRPWSWLLRWMYFGQIFFFRRPYASLGPSVDGT
jgi:hypothetical protein